MKNDKRHVMMDLETWGTRSGSALRSVGAVVFDPKETGVDAETFYANIDRQSCSDMGLTEDASTVAWWDRQSAEAEATLAVDQRPLREVVRDFNRWFRATGCAHVWSHGASFDVVLWEWACLACDEKEPWKFWDVRDTRTLYHLAGVDLKSVPRDGVHHNALDDAVHQARCVQLAYQTLGLSKRSLVS